MLRIPVWLKSGECAGWPTGGLESPDYLNDSSRNHTLHIVLRTGNPRIWRETFSLFLSLVALIAGTSLVISCCVYHAQRPTIRKNTMQIRRQKWINNRLTNHAESWWLAIVPKSGILRRNSHLYRKEMTVSTLGIAVTIPWFRPGRSWSWGRAFLPKNRAVGILKHNA